MSQPSRALKSLLDAGDVPYENHVADILKGENRTPEMLALNPAGSLPFITVDGEPLYESAAILRYLAVKFPSLNQFYPEGAEHRAKIDAALDFSGTSFRPTGLAVFAPIVFPRRAGKEPAAAVHEASAASEVKLLGLIGMMNKAMEKKGHKFCGGNTINIADFQLFCEMFNITYRG